MLLLIDDPELIMLTTGHKSIECHVREHGSTITLPEPTPGLVDYWGCFDDNDNYYGYFRIDKLTSGMAEIHTCLLPNARGNYSKKFRSEMMDILTSRYEISVLITKIPSCNRLALKFALDGGMIKMGSFDKCWKTKEGLVDLIVLKKSIGRASCQQQQ